MKRKSSLRNALSFRMLNKQRAKAGLLVCSVLGAASAHAQIDTTEVLAELTSAEGTIAAIGGAILVLAAISMTYRWAKATFF